jgi:hypothetical protein
MHGAAMSVFLTVTAAAADRGLLTQAALRAAAGLASGDSSRDTELQAIGLAVSDIISVACNVAGDGINPPTLLQETLQETVRPAGALDCLILSRRFVGTIAIVEDDIDLVESTDFAVDRSTGLVTRLSCDRDALWCAGKIVVTYQAGFATVPTPLADVAAAMVSRRTGADRDPLVKRERIRTEGVEEVEREFWVSAANDADITPDMKDKLAAYRTEAVG